MKRLLAAALLAAPLAPVSLPAAAAARPAFPPYAGAYEPQGTDERGLWMQADEDERGLRDSSFVVRDAALNAYVRGVLCRAVGAERCAGVRLYILRVPAFNASMAPNGTLRLYTGTLLRVRNEAELAAVLGHEFGHFEERHGLASYRQRRTASDIASWAIFMGSGGAVIQSAAVGSTFSFSRAQESAADQHSFNYLAASGYRPGAFADIWARMMDEADATAQGRHQRSQRYDRVSFFSDHPTSHEREATIRALATKQGDSGDDGEDRYRAALAAWQPQFLADQIKLNDFEGTEYLLGQLARAGWSADLLMARADLYRLRGNPRDLVSAAGFYRQAIAAGTTDPAAYRGLGLALVRSGDLAAGRQALGDYLQRQPEAQDKAMIASLIEP